MARRKKKEKELSSTKTIKRYGNRKLYDTQQSRYVTLDEISEMVRRGEDIQVIDNKTHEDLTTVTFTQIMLEEEKNKKNILPRHLLKNIIQQSHGSVEDLLQKGKDSITTMRIEAEEQLSKIVEMGHQTRGEGTRMIRDWIASPQKYLDYIQRKVDERIKFFFSQLTGLEELEKEIQTLENKLSGLERRLWQTAARASATSSAPALQTTKNITP